MITASRVQQHISDVTSEDIGRAHKAFSIVDGKSTAFYMVESSDPDNFDAEGNRIEYKVQYSKERGFSCTCKAGQSGFANVHNRSGVCQHVRIAVAAACEERAAMAEMALKDACGVLSEQPKTDQTREAVCDECGAIAIAFDSDKVEFVCEKHK